MPAEAVGVAAARAHVERAARMAGLSAARTADLLVAVSEGVTNAIEAHERARSDEPIAVRCAITASTLEVAVTDAGGGFEPSALQARPPLEHPGHLDVERGWGIQLMRELTDGVDFDTTRAGTTVRLRMVRG